jgi:hypothetical protein
MKRIAILLLVFSSSYSATLYVPGQYPTIMDAIGAAVDGDTVIVGSLINFGSVSFMGKNIVVKADPPGGALLTNWIDTYCVYFTGGEDSTAVLDGFRISNTDHGNGMSGSTPRYEGGGIYIENSSPTIRNNYIYECFSSGYGGGICAASSSSLIEGNTIIDNNASDGGGLYLDGYSAGGPIRIVSNDIVSNSAGNAGGIFSSCDLLLVNNRILQNEADTGSGGGLRITGGNVSLFGNLIQNNACHSYGGGIIVDASVVSFEGNIISMNNADFIGGGLFIYSSFCYAENNTISGNNALEAGYGIGGIGTLNVDTLSLLNTIVWDNSAPNSFVDNVGLFDTNLFVDYSNIEDGIDSIYVDSLSVVYWGEGNIDADPLFETGLLSDYHLSLGSPCIDAGNPAPEYYDPEDPFNPGYALWPAMGFLRNDMGAYGGSGVGYWLGVEETEPVPPGDAPVLSAYPNPFRDSTTLIFELPRPGRAEVRVYDLSGCLVDVLFDDEVPRGPACCRFDAGDLPSGVYIIRVDSGSGSASLRSILIR